MKQQIPISRNCVYRRLDRYQLGVLYETLLKEYKQLYRGYKQTDKDVGLGKLLGKFEQVIDEVRIVQDEFDKKSFKDERLDKMYGGKKFEDLCDTIIELHQQNEKLSESGDVDHKSIIMANEFELRCIRGLFPVYKGYPEYRGDKLFGLIQMEDSNCLPDFYMNLNRLI